MGGGEVCLVGQLLSRSGGFLLWRSPSATPPPLPLDVDTWSMCDHYCASTTGRKRLHTQVIFQRSICYIHLTDKAGEKV